MQATDGCTLVIDTSYGSTVGVVGHEPIVETDSRTHVEKLQVNIARAMDAAGLGPADISCIVVGVGPAPFTGLRAGLVTAKALAFATGARLIGQNILDPQDAVLRAALRGDAVIADAAGFLADVSHTAQNGQVDGRPEPEHHITLCVNDARRKQLYFSLNHEAGVTGSWSGSTPRYAVARRLAACDTSWTWSVTGRPDTPTHGKVWMLSARWSRDPFWMRGRPAWRCSPRWR